MSVILAADIGGTTCKLGIFDKHLQLLEKWQVNTDIANNGENILTDIHESFMAKEREVGFSVRESLGAGIGAPGPVNFKDGVLNGGINLNWEGRIPIASRFEKLSGVSTIVDNDANLAALGEQSKGAGHGHADAAMLTLGTGVGGGIVSDGMLIHGFGGAAGEIGHIMVDFKQRFSCNCGKKGCLETVASATGIVNIAEFKHRHENIETKLADQIEHGTITSKTLMEAAEEGDALAVSTVNEASHYIAIAISSISAVTNPGYIILGGGVSAAGQFLIDRIEKYYRPVTFPPASEGVEIVTAELGNDAGMYGAAKLVKQYLIQ
ncbi:ROK family glucokinase [Salinicoccus albus]|uniref:ROK family glucokinase n=1 Tax=Salinicoccus albus TaxID=418756 RepID=UPI00036259C4|nr:ROK family glucokinase [Salinicoccus albus]